jgi:hypothetical protein
MKYLNRSFSVAISNPDYDRIFARRPRLRAWCPYIENFLTIQPPRTAVYCPWCYRDGRKTKLKWKENKCRSKKSSLSTPRPN